MPTDSQLVVIYFAGGIGCFVSRNRARYRVRGYSQVFYKVAAAIRMDRQCGRVAAEGVTGNVKVDFDLLVCDRREVVSCVSAHVLSNEKWVAEFSVNYPGRLFTG